MPVLESASDQAYLHQLPTVSFRIIEDKSLEQPVSVSVQFEKYGYNEIKDFARPEAYIRYIEPIEAELKKQVEYDMDEQDQAWLDSVNEERKKDGSGPVSYETFEILMDHLEKEWFELIKRIPQPASHLPVEDSKCAVCDDGEGENSNAIVFCDGCNLAVHQDCYGVPYIPEGQWLCRKCTVSPENPVSCLFCPNEGGAFKQTQSGHWSHLLCAIWIPELGLGNAIYMEPVEGAELVPKNRWKLNCSLCKDRYGACIQCDNKACFTAFHVTCARQMGLLQGMKSMGTDTQLRAFCHKHLPADVQGVVDLDEADSDYSGTPARPKKQKIGTVTTKSARAHAKSYRPGPPIVPHMIVQNLIDYTMKISIRKRQIFIERLCRYWSLKREARRGAPLLKRLHLEPWTASTASKQQTEAEKATKLKFLMKLRNDLEKVRTLAEYVKKRENKKLLQTEAIRDVVEGFLFPHFARLRLIYEKITAMDRSQMFLNPVNQVEIPDYATVIKEPMCWLWIDDKIERNIYRSVSEFVRDINLVLDNAMLYNAKETPYHKNARRIKTNSQPLLDDLASISIQAALKAPDDDAEETGIPDMEPSRILLQALLHPDKDQADRDNLAALFAYEMEKPKEPTPPPPSPPKKKKKHDSSADRRQKLAEREARARERELAGPVRLTRKAKALEVGNEEQVNAKQLEAGPSSGRKASETVETSARRANRQVGVVGLEVVDPISDKERRKREKEMDLVTSEVHKDDMFKRFNVGWVLAEGSKRERKARFVEAPKPNSRKRKSEAAASAPPESPERTSTPSPPPSSLTPVSSLSPTSTVQSVPTTKLRNDKDKTSRRKSEPNRVSVSNQERGNGGRWKRKRAETAEDADAESKVEDVDMTPMPSSPPAPTSEVLQKKQENKTNELPVDESEVTTPGRSRRKLAAASTQDVIQAARNMDKPVKRRPGKEKQEDDDAGDKSETRVLEGEADEVADGSEDEDGAEAEVDDLYPPQTLVWARMRSFPYFPAEVIDENAQDADDPIPDYVFESRDQLEKQNAGEGVRTWLVRFFDASSSYAWVPESRLDVLGVDDNIDQGYLSGRGRKAGKPIKADTRKKIAQSYRDALSYLQDPDAEEDEEEEQVE